MEKRPVYAAAREISFQPSAVQRKSREGRSGTAGRTRSRASQAIYRGGTSHALKSNGPSSGRDNTKEASLMWVAGADGIPASGSAGLNPTLLSLRLRACMHWDGTCVHTVDITHSFFQQAFKPYHVNGTRTYWLQIILQTHSFFTSP